ncbi:hypothetical protein [Paenibacillus daejeonensis]|uniref:hypothetical protein n=1 Tax=Paenibacillus daejeonensis TaxID=135193 RepID=UPI000360C2F3|nr:hypothetical protein [Paenibacillus daejeonensis]
MSEHTSAFVTRVSFEKKLEDLGITAFQPLNEEWLVFSGAVEEIEQQLIEVSKEVPILYFTHSEDLGWEYVLLASGEEKARFSYSYMIDHEAVIELLESKYPNQDPHDLLYGDAGDLAEAVNELIGQFYNDGAYEALVRKALESVELDALAVLGKEEDRIEALKKAIAYQGQEMKHSEIVEYFLAIMNLEEIIA